MAKLGEYCEVNPAKATLPDDTLVSFVPMTAVGEEGTIDVSATKAYADVKTGFTCFQNGDVLFAKITPCMENGKGAIAENLHNGIGFGSTEFHVLRPDPARLDSKYLYYCTVWPTFRKDCERNMTGSAGQKRVPKKYIETYELNIPDLPTQRRIAATLDKVSEGIAVCRQMLADLDTLVKARFVEMFGEPIQNPLGWPVVRLKEVSTLITNGNTPKGGSENYVDKGITFLRSQNVWRNRIDLEDVAYIDEATHRGLKKSSLHYKDILITKTGRINTENSSLGRAALFLGEDDSANINGHVYLIRLDGSIVPEFVVTIFTGEAYRKYIRKVCVGGIDKRQINVDQVEDFPIIVPPYEKQQEFASFREHINKSKVVVQKVLDKAQLLFDSLMQKYFG